jgi:hypothetical protein
MDKLENYRNIIIQFLKEVGSYTENNPDYFTHTIIDKENDHYLLLDVGWNETNQRIYSIQLHFDIINYKIWIQKDITSYQPVSLFLKQGILKEDIVLGYLPKHKRKFTEYAIA